MQLKTDNNKERNPTTNRQVLKSAIVCKKGEIYAFLKTEAIKSTISWKTCVKIIVVFLKKGDIFVWLMLFGTHRGLCLIYESEL